MAGAWGNWQLWLKGLAAALISGGANGVVTGFSLVGVDSSHFNLAGGLSNLLHVAGAVAVASGLLGAAAYLKQSPVPANGVQP